jgi:protein-L-isoaspartate(D-aspartate) O-methyltransferase
MILAASFVVVCLCCNPTAQAQSRNRYRDLRWYMVSEYIEKEGIKDQRVLTSMRTVPRHEFVRSSMRSKAYTDEAWPIGHKQTISPPFIVAYMTEIIETQPTEKVLEIGTGSGYQAAVLSGLVKDVYTIEIVAQLGRAAAKRLKKLRYENVHVRIGDGYKGWPEEAPFDKIIVTCSPEDVPQPLVDQLKEGGKMIIPLGQRYQQVFHLFEKKNGKLVQTKLIPTLFVPMTGRSEEKRELKPDPLNPKIVNGGFEKDENQDGRPDHWHYQRQTSLMDQDAPQGKRFLRFQNRDLGRSAQLLQGMALDGKSIHSLSVRLKVKYENTAAGEQAFQKPAFIIHFYDINRRPIGESLLGPWLGTRNWKTVSKSIVVPRKAREAVVRIGLNGATGLLSVDDLSLSAKLR